MFNILMICQEFTEWRSCLFRSNRTRHGLEDDRRPL